MRLRLRHREYFCLSNIQMRGLHIHRLRPLLSQSINPGGWSISTTPTLRVRGWCSAPEKVAAPIIRRKGKGDREQTAPFVDKRLVVVHGGNGGDGCIAFTKIFGNEFAGPDGGDGGNGGHVVFEATSSSKSLAHLSSIIEGNPGGRGTSCNCTGANGTHLIIPVPLGTIFKTPSEDGSPPQTLADLSEASSFFIGARGGCGGKGNKFFATASNQSPEISEYGGIGERFTYLLEMSVIADFGLVGFPNAGKSTLLRAISRARPKVASYAFTTLRPHVGVVFFEDMDRITVADIPGLIPDAHRNRGLGIQFLRHIQRCLGLIYVIDFSDEDPLAQFQALYKELSVYDPKLVGKHSVILANKLDSEEARVAYEANKDAFPKEFGPLIPISAKYGMGLKELLEGLRTISDQKKKQNPVQEVYNPVREAEDGVTRWR